MPQVISVNPSNRYNGANNNVENYTFLLQAGSYPLKNLTIHWNDGVGSLNRNATTSFTTLTGAQLSYTISHTFPLPTAYQTNATICDTQGVCLTYPTPITIGQQPLSQNSIGSIYNQTARKNNQTALNQSGSIQSSQNPTETIAVGAIIFIVGAIAVLYWFRIRKANK